MRDPRLTEQRNPRSTRIDQLNELEIVDLVNAEDRMVTEAVGEERQAGQHQPGADHDQDRRARHAGGL